MGKTFIEGRDDRRLDQLGLAGDSQQLTLPARPNGVYLSFTHADWLTGTVAPHKLA